MLRKSDTADIRELEKYGFKYGARDKFIFKTKKNGVESRMYIDLQPSHNNNNEMKIESDSCFISEKLLDKLYDLIKENLVVKE